MINLHIAILIPFFHDFKVLGWIFIDDIVELLFYCQDIFDIPVVEQELLEHGRRILLVLDEFVEFGEFVDLIGE